MVLRRLYDRKIRLVVRHVDRATRVGGERPWVSGACLAARRADLVAVGLFDERYTMYLEDVDLCTMVRKRGRKVIFAPQAEVLHLRGRSAARNADTSRLRRRSHVAYYDKHLPRWSGLLRTYLRVTGKGTGD
jgi:GT2 family glycosyltransferase